MSRQVDVDQASRAEQDGPVSLDLQLRIARAPTDLCEAAPSLPKATPGKGERPHERGVTTAARATSAGASAGVGVCPAPALDDGAVRFGHPRPARGGVGGGGDEVREAAIVGEEQQALRVVVEAADGKDPRDRAGTGSTEAVEDGTAGRGLALLARGGGGADAAGGEDAPRLIEEEVDETLRGAAPARSGL